MPSLNWGIFDALPGSKYQNFENLCRGLVRIHYGRFGQFKALSNQPGVEFHLQLIDSCTLGDPPRWFGWQCKNHKRNANGNLPASARNEIESSLRTTEAYLPDITDWFLWTPYTLNKQDQEWFYALSSKMRLGLWADEEIDNLLSGNGLILRSTYFGELIVTPHDLAEQHGVAVMPIKDRWLSPVHQSVDAERTIRRMLGEPGSWDQLIEAGKSLKEAEGIINQYVANSKPEIQMMVRPFTTTCSSFSDTLLRFHEILAEGDLDVIQQKLGERKTLINKEVRIIPRKLRLRNMPIALVATNAFDDMKLAQKLLDEVEEFLGVGIVAVLADAGGGKTQLAAQLTAPQENRPAGVFLQGRALQRGQTLDTLAHRFSIYGNPMQSMEKLIAALDAAGKRACCRLPLFIDGLNEAENPKDWKSELASLSETIKKYPNVLIVCTLRTGERRREDEDWRNRQQLNNRESFAVMSVPEEILKIESDGFGGDVDEAVNKYFDYFKINPGDTEIPLDFLEHPLTLRIFCQVTNPARQEEVLIKYFPASLTPLFEKYIANAGVRISQLSNLSHDYSESEVAHAIYMLGIELWESNQREIDEASYRARLSDTNRDWNSSIVNLLAQEGIIFRNPGSASGEYVITPTYDALGGFIIADALLKKYATDTTFSWLNGANVISSFSGEGSHELASDTFKSLITLTPRRMYGIQIWKVAPEGYQNTALLYATELEAGYIDSDTVAALLELLRTNHKARVRLFNRLQATRSATNHPFNSEFLNTALRQMSVSERDLSWSEWVRGGKREKFNDLLAIEQRWKQHLGTRTDADRLRAIWVMWLLTSTAREFRDIATRTLYWYGRGAPDALFNECLNSLPINDPYISERMLAASYGVAMAVHVHMEQSEFLDEILPSFARSLYSFMFSVGAKFGTTHLLTRDYATGIIELAALHDDKLFSSEELIRTKPPFKDGGLRKWGGANSKKELNRADSPFQMDFENYSIGKLVEDRRNYDFKHKEYQKIKNQILWRVQQLGWSSKLFKDIDDSIGKEHWSRSGSESKKTDRYGKKYSWIAYFEMSGLLQDQGKIENYRERSSSVDIDPSFPEKQIRQPIIKDDLLGAYELDIREWISSGPTPTIGPYLHLKEIEGIQGPWICIDGFVEQQDKKRGRSLFCGIRSFLVTQQDAATFLDYMSNFDFGERWIPEKPSTIYTFAGEIPWSSVFLPNGSTEISFLIKEETVKVKRTQPKLYLDGKELDLSQLNQIRHPLFEIPLEENQTPVEVDDLKRVEVREALVEVEEFKREYAKFDTLTPVCDFGWESYHTVASYAGHATTLAKEMATGLELVGKPQTFDLFTKDNRNATLFCTDQRGDFHNHQFMFFIREDLLNKYLEENKLTLVWTISGERGYSIDQVEKLFHGPNCPEQTHATYSLVKQYSKK